MKVSLIVLFGLLAMMYWFAVPLVAINRLSPWQAMKTSLSGCWSNMGALMVYGLVYIGLAIVASIPFGLGWLVLAPVLVGSWALRGLIALAPGRSRSRRTPPSSSGIRLCLCRRAVHPRARASAQQTGAAAPVFRGGESRRVVSRCRSSAPAAWRTG